MIAPSLAQAAEVARRKLRWLLVLVGVLGWCGPAHANDTSVGGTGVDLVSLKESSVHMQAEDITLTYREGSWHIVARYTFENPTPQEVKLQVGFPEVGCPKSEEGDCHAKAFRDLKTEVDGTQVAHRKGSLAKTERWAQHLGTFWLFDVVFPAKKELSIVHRYAMDATVDSMGGTSVFYVTRTGATWAKPIGIAKFRFRVPPYATYLMTNQVLGPPKNPTFVKEGTNAFTEVIFEKKQWTPAGDLDFTFATAFGQFPVPRLERDTLAQRAKDLGLGSEAVCPWQAHDTPAPETPAQAQSCRNLIYARWGFSFKKKTLRELFYEGGEGWHVPKNYGPLTLTRDPAPLPEFSMAWTSASERRLLKDIPSESTAPAGSALPSAAASAAPTLLAKTRHNDKPTPPQLEKTVPPKHEPGGNCSIAARLFASGSWLTALAVLLLLLTRRRAARGIY